MNGNSAQDVVQIYLVQKNYDLDTCKYILESIGNKRSQLEIHIEKNEIKITQK